MTIDKLKASEPLFGSWFVDSKISEGNGSKFFKVYKTENGQIRYLGLKTVKFPRNEQELSRVISSGKYRNIDEYLDLLQSSITKNMNKMMSLRDNPNIVRFDNFTIVRESSCFYVVMLMELLTPLADYLKFDSVEKMQAVKLGQDICKALESFRMAGIVHHDIKPENIYVDAKGNYKLGDYGIFDYLAQNLNEPSAYIAPELYNKTAASDTASDIYSLGILLYKLLNNNRVPFLPPHPAPVSLTDRETAFAKCMRGELFPTPAKADYELAKIIFKATAFRPTDRYYSPSLMIADLGNYEYSVLTAPPVVPDEINRSSFEIGADDDIHFDSYEDSADEIYEDEYTDTVDDTEEDKPKKQWYFIVLALIIVLALVIALVVNATSDKDDKTTTKNTTEYTTSAPIVNLPVTQETTTEPTTEETTTEETTTEPTTTETTTEPTTTETTTKPTTTEPTTTEPTTTEPTTTEPLTEPTLVSTNKKNGDKSPDGKTYLKISSYELQEIPEDEFFRQVVLTIGDNLGESPVGDSAYFYQMSGPSVIQKVAANIECEISEDYGGDVLCTVSVDDTDFYYEPENYQYYLCFEEGSIESDTVISLPLQIKIK